MGLSKITKNMVGAGLGSGEKMVLSLGVPPVILNPGEFDGLYN